MRSRRAASSSCWWRRRRGAGRVVDDLLGAGDGVELGERPLGLGLRGAGCGGSRRGDVPRRARARSSSASSWWRRSSRARRSGPSSRPGRWGAVPLSSARRAWAGWSIQSVAMQRAKTSTAVSSPVVAMNASLVSRAAGHRRRRGCGRRSARSRKTRPRSTVRPWAPRRCGRRRGRRARRRSGRGGRTVPWRPVTVSDPSGWMAVDGPHGPVADHLAAVGDEAAVVAAGWRSRRRRRRARRRRSSVAAVGVDLTGVEARLLAAVVEPLGGLVGRCHQQAPSCPPGVAPTRRATAARSIWLEGAAVEAAVGVVDVGDVDVTAAQPQAGVAFPVVARSGGPGRARWRRRCRRAGRTCRRGRRRRTAAGRRRARPASPSRRRGRPARRAWRSGSMPASSTMTVAPTGRS